MEHAVEIFAVVHLTVMGFSHILAPRAWAEFFVMLRKQGRPGVFMVGFMSLYFGSIIAAFHNVWEGLPMILSLLGWAQVVKATAYFVYPAYGLRMLEVVDPDKPRQFVIAGAGLLAIAGVVAAGWL